jgi:ligand-binding SRPBCC domain-containing protein
MPRFEITSTVPVARERVWAQVSTMAGVNAELWPIVMTYPREVAALNATQAVMGQPMFRSWVLLFGVLPIDRHELTLVSVDPPAGFHEDSRSWLQRRWIHIRTLEETPGGCRITDCVEFEPRLPGVGGLLLPVFRAVFANRHRYLRRHFGRS